MKTISRIFEHKPFLIISGIFPLVVFVIILIYIFNNQQQKVFHNYLNKSVNNASHFIEVSIQKQIGLQSGLAASLTLDSGNFESFRIIVQRIKINHPEWRTVIVTDHNKPVFNLRFRSDETITPLRDRDSLEVVWDTLQPYVGNLANGFVAIRVPVIRSNQIIYTLAIPIDPDYFLQAVTLPLKDDPWGYIIVGSDGIVISASANAPVKKEELLPAHYYISSSHQHFSDNHNIYTSPQPIGHSGWKLLLFADESNVIAPFFNAQFLIYTGGLVTVFITILLILAISSTWAARLETAGLKKKIFERQNIVKELRQSELFLKEAQQLGEIGSWRWDLVSNEHIWTEEVFRIYGRDSSLPPAIYPEVQKYFLPQSWQQLQSTIEESIKLKIPYECDSEIIKPNGEHRWITARGKPIFNETGTLISFQGTVQDITERKRIENLLRASEIRYRFLFENSLDAIAIFEGVPLLSTFVNPSFVDMFGYTESEIQSMQGPEFWGLIHPDDLYIAKSKFHELLDGKTKSSRYEHRIIRKDGIERWVEASVTMIQADDHIINLIFLRDITDQKNAEKERELLQAQFLHAQKMESIGRLAGGVAHDFNNILTIIKGYTEIAMSQVKVSDPLHEDLDTIKDAADRSTDIIKQLLTFSRKQIIEPRLVNLNDCVEGMLKMISRLVGENITLSCYPYPKLPNIEMDPSQIDQILANLCVNARDAIKDTGKISIETDLTVLDKEYCSSHFSALPGQYAVLTVSDNGRGMDKEVIAKIFDPFFSTKGDAGTGLGLATVYGIVKQNNGYINVYSELGKGTSFKIYFPIATNGISLEEDKVTETETGNGEIILFVEDEPAILKLLKVMLKDLGYEVITSSNPQEAITLAKEYGRKIDLLITDVIMPEMNGKELSQQILSYFPELKVIYMSGYTANVIAHHGILDKDINFIQKPFSKQKIAQKIRSVLS